MRVNRSVILSWNKPLLCDYVIMWYTEVNEYYKQRDADEQILQKINTHSSWEILDMLEHLSSTEMCNNLNFLEENKKLQWHLAYPKGGSPQTDQDIRQQ